MRAKSFPPRASHEKLGRVLPHKLDPVIEYTDHLASTISGDLSGLRVAVDCANGASSTTIGRLLRQVECSCEIRFREPDGLNINDGCGSTHLEQLKERVRKGDFDLGVAFDGDADRCLAVDENGELIDGDKILAICGMAMKQQNTLKNDTIVATIMSNMGLSLLAKKQGIQIEQTNVGDRYVLERMIEKNYNLGGEQSGHIIFLDYNTTGDGILTAIQFLTVMKKTGKKASELANMMETMPQVLVNAKVNNSKKNDYMKVPEIKQAIENLNAKFNGEGRVLIRTSGTEPLVRVMIEGKDLEVMQKEAEKLAELISEKLQ